MYQDKYQYGNRKKGGDVLRIITVVLLGLLLITMMVFVTVYLMQNRTEALETNTNNVKTSKKNETKDSGYTELIGCTDKTLSEDSPYLIMENPSNNKTYLKFELFEDDEMIYVTGYLSPGEKESFDAWNCFDEGEYTLTWEITVYDDSFEPVSGTVVMLQDVKVKGEQ